MKEISFNEKGYQKALRNLNKCIEIVNSYSQKFKDEGKNIDKELLKDIAANGLKARNNIYINELKKVAESFEVEYEKIKTLEFTINNSLFSDIANGRCKLYYMFIQDIARLLYGQTYLIQYIDILNNIATKTIDAEKELQEYFIDYTNNDKEDKVLIQLNKLKKIYLELKQLGVNKYDVNCLINDDDNQINGKVLHRICK